jgi:DNA invertase Pin-like site-specific DNA recombinase
MRDFAEHRPAASLLLRASPAFPYLGQQHRFRRLVSLARARQNGTKLGRRRVKPSVEATIRELRAKGDGILKIARTLGVGTSVVQRVVLDTA